MRRIATTALLLCLLAAPAGAATHRIAAISITPAVLPAATNGTAYNQALTGNGGTGPYTFAVTAGSLPPGITLSNAGLLSGTPTSSGSYSFTVTATDSLSASGSQAFSLSVSPAAISISPTTLSPASRNVFYSASLSCSGGTATCTFAVTSGALPTGLALAANGSLTGTPGATGSFTFTVTATDTQGSSGARSFTLNVNVANLDISPAGLEDAPPGAPYSKLLSGSGGTAPYTFALVNGSTLPPGLSLSSAGAITGTPSQVGTYTFSVKVTDSASQSATRAFVLKVPTAALTVGASFPDAQYAKAYDATFGTNGGSAPYTYTLAGGSLPAGLTLAANGDLSGTPTASGTFHFSVTSTDAYGATGTFPFTFVVDAAHIVLAPDELFAATPGLFYAAQLNATGGVGTYTYSLPTGALPAGLVLSADGTISGTVDAGIGLYTFTVQAADAYGAAGTIQLTLKVATPSILFTTLALPVGLVGSSFSAQLTADGGNQPYTFTLADGTLPSGLALTAGGVLSGTPTTAGTWLFTVQLTDAHGSQATQSFRLVVEKPTPPVKTKTVVKQKTAKKKVVKKH